MKEQIDQSSNLAKRTKSVSKKELEEQVKGLADKMDALVEIVGDLVSALPKKAEPIKSSESSKMVQSAPEIDSSLPPPSKWRQKVNELLGENFGLAVDESSSGNYIIKVIVPKELDRRVGSQRSTGEFDISVGLVRRASDLADVERWCKLIRDNIRKQYPDFQKGVA